jgi:crotonobetainyl-CoA:carnitine CoA-transferase CaiB-like acyl-CoA transferase
MVGPVKSIEEAVDDPHIQARDLVEDADGMLRRVGFPVGGLDGLDRTEQPAPDLGEHTDEVLGEAGYGDDEIASLRERDVI